MLLIHSSLTKEITKHFRAGVLRWKLHMAGVNEVQDGRINYSTSSGTISGANAIFPITMKLITGSNVRLVTTAVGSDER